MRTPLIAGNWKLNLDRKAARELAVSLKNGTRKVMGNVDVAIAPVATALVDVADGLAGSSIMLLGQNCYHEPHGAFTGEVSASLLHDAGCGGCILGHSERRQLFGETDDGVRQKLASVLEAGLVPIVCVGETLEEREAGTTNQVVLRQLAGALEGFEATDLKTLVIAYEPVWAIGTGRTASPSDAQEVHAAIRSWLSERLGGEASQAIRLLYGGSVKPDNAADLLGQTDIDGALVGGASLKAESFLAIISAAAG